jgi:hypothetical protein
MLALHDAGAQVSPAWVSHTPLAPHVALVPHAVSWHVVAQQVPITQIPLEHWPLPLQGAPFACLLLQCLVESQIVPFRQSPSTPQVVAQALPLHL